MRKLLAIVTIVLAVYRGMGAREATARPRTVGGTENAAAAEASEARAPALAADRATGPGADLEAARLYAEGLRHFRAGDYDRSIAALKAAYFAAPLPPLLYNLGQAFRLKGECAEALAFYRRFLATAPDGDERTRTEARITEMQRCADGSATPAGEGAQRRLSSPALSLCPSNVEKTPAVALPAVASVPVASTPSPPAEVAATPTPHRRAGVLFAAGAGLLASGSGYFAWRASEASDRVRAASLSGEQWSGASDVAWDDRLALAAGAMALASAVVAAWLLSK